MSKITNVFIMLELLNSGKKYSLKKLSEELGVSERMVRYYKEQLELAGIIIDSYKGPDGGYFINKENKFKVSFFNKYDIELLERIKPIIEKEKDSPLEKEYNELLKRLKSTYKVNKEVSEYDEVEVVLYSEDKKLKFFSDAIKNRKSVSILFQGVDNKFTKRIIDPITFFEYNNRKHLTAFCHLRGTIRHFDLDKIVEYIEI